MMFYPWIWPPNARISSQSFFGSNDYYFD